MSFFNWCWGASSAVERNRLQMWRIVNIFMIHNQCQPPVYSPLIYIKRLILLSVIQLSGGHCRKTFKQEKSRKFFCIWVSLCIRMCVWVWHACLRNLGYKIKGLVMIIMVGRLVLEVQWKSLNVITMGQFNSDNIRWKTIITSDFHFIY